MAKFTWKRHTDIFKGVGIYHLTFVVRDRQPLLGRLICDAQMPSVERTPLGSALARTIEYLPVHYQGLKIIAKQVMPDHIHLALHLYEDHGYSIKEIARGLRQAWRKDYMKAMGVNISRLIVSAEPYEHSAQPPIPQTPTPENGTPPLSLTRHISARLHGAGS